MCHLSRARQTEVLRCSTWVIKQNWYAMFGNSGTCGSTGSFRNIRKPCLLQCSFNQILSIIPWRNIRRFPGICTAHCDPYAQDSKRWYFPLLLCIFGNLDKRYSFGPFVVEKQYSWSRFFSLIKWCFEVRIFWSGLVTELILKSMKSMISVVRCRESIVLIQILFSDQMMFWSFEFFVETGYCTKGLI